VEENFAATKIKFGPMPGTNHAAIADCALTQGSPVVRAFVADREKLAVDVKHRNPICWQT
jgi:hypothetical protein